MKKGSTAAASSGKTGTRAGSTKRTSAPKKSSPAQAAEEQDQQGESLLEKFFLDQLKDMYYAENKILKALPQMEEACTSEELREAFGDHRHQTTKHVQRLDRVFKMMGQQAEAKKCEAIEGIVKECESIIADTQEGSMTRDAALIMAAQKVEHYEIATYGGLVQFAITMGKKDVAEVLDKTLLEEEETDRRLTWIAETDINIEAEEEGKYSWNKQRVAEKETVEEEE